MKTEENKKSDRQTDRQTDRQADGPTTFDRLHHFVANLSA